MTNEQAINAVELRKNITHNKNEFKLCDVIIKALEKQVPTKTVEQGFIYCGKCEMKIDSIGWGWCPHCGRAIDWSDEK